jgi:hypothetical protein
MSEESKSAEVLDTQINAIANTHTNLAGLIQKAVGIQSELMSAGFSEYSDAIGEPFSAMSTAAEKFQQLIHDMEIERNRLRTEG